MISLHRFLKLNILLVSYIIIYAFVITQIVYNNSMEIHPNILTMTTPHLITYKLLSQDYFYSVRTTGLYLKTTTLLLFNYQAFYIR